MIRTLLCLVVLCVGGEAQKLCTKPLDILIAFDVSGSTDPATFNKLRTFLNNLVGTFEISNAKARIVVFGFDHQARFSGVTSFDQAGAQSLAGVRNQINSIPFNRGGTNITLGLVEAINVFNGSTVRPNVPRVAVFASDGENQGGSDSLRIPAQQLRTDFNARVVGLGVGARNTINVDAFDVLTGNRNQLIILEFKKSSCSGGDGDSDDDDDERDDDSSGESSGDEGGSCSTELSKTASLICG